LHEAREVIGIDADNEYNVAFVGEAGVGKSSLINALLCVKDNDPIAARVSQL
jgi:GTP-binding protein EngB required for normal cell division